MLLNTGEYKESLGHVIKIISSARSNAAQKASAEMIHMYWLVGNELVARSEWGKNTSRLFRRTLELHFRALRVFRFAASGTWRSSYVRWIQNCAAVAAQFHGAI